MRPAALVVGGSGGIGAAVSRRLAADGFDVALTYRSRETVASALVAELRDAGRDAVAVPVEFGDAATIRRAVATAVERFGRLDAAVYAGGPWVEWDYAVNVDAEAFVSLLQEDAGACFAMLAAALPHLRRAKGAAVAISTPAVERAIKRDVLAAAPKAAVEALIRTVALEEGRYGVRANSVAVGPITGGVYHELVRRGLYSPEVLEAARKRIPLGRFGTELDIADGVAFLVSAGWITGQTLRIDGGSSI